MESEPRKYNQQKKMNNRGRGQKRYRGGNRGGQNYPNSNYNKSYNSYPSNYQQQYQYPYQNQSQYFNPYFHQQMIYRTEMYISSMYKHLLNINIKNVSIAKSIDSNSKFFVIKSFSEEDVHKSIKYGVWSSSKNGNLTLKNAFNITKEKNGNVYLFFSCNGSGRFCGVAKMKTDIDENKTFDFWTQDNKWPGLFEVEWIFIKDVPFKEFKDIIITMKDGEIKPVSNSRDTQEIPFEQAKIMMEKVETYQNSNTILEHFEFYDLRQENYVKNLQAKQNYENPNSQNQNKNVQK
jgi:hypothetical protein